MQRDPAAWSRLGEIIRDARSRRGLTQDELAARANVSSRSVQDAEAGRVPRGRMPYTLSPIARALDWPPGTIESVLDGNLPPGWSDVPVQRLVDARTIGTAITNAMLKAADNVTAAEIRRATEIALDELREAGVISETDVVQPKTNRP